MDSLRRVTTSYGVITYTLRRKRVKNLNLRMDGEGEITLSVPLRCPIYRADEMILQREDWIHRHREQLALRREVELLPEVDRARAMELLRQAMLRVYPLVEPLGVALPQLKLRSMTGQWGNCHWSQGYITLNTALCRCPPHLRDYVALHELVHFLHHDHGPGFRDRMTRLMPDWKERRQELKGYGGALRPQKK